MARVGVGTEEDDRGEFAGSPLALLFFFCSSPFPFYFSAFYLNTAVILLFKDPNKIRKI